MAGAVYRLRNHRHVDDQKTNGFSKLAPSVLVVCAYGLCYFALTRAMSTIPVGVAYSLWCGFGIVGVTICSMILYKQNRISRPSSPWC